MKGIILSSHFCKLHYITSPIHMFLENRQSLSVYNQTIFHLIITTGRKRVVFFLNARFNTKEVNHARWINILFQIHHFLHYDNVIVFHLFVFAQLLIVHYEFRFHIDAESFTRQYNNQRILGLLIKRNNYTRTGIKIVIFLRIFSRPTERCVIELISFKEDNYEDL